MATHNELGALGEQIAVDYLIERGYQIIERNWSNGHKEIDIIAKDDDTIVIDKNNEKRIEHIEDAFYPSLR